MLERPIEKSAAHTVSDQPSALTVKGLNYRVDGRPLVDGLTLELAPEGISVVMGPNGAGKSLFLRLIHGLLEPDHGDIRWGTQRAGPQTSRRQALVFQTPVLLRRAVSANMDFVMKARGCFDPERRDALLRRVGLAELAKSPARKLSGGERQRLQLARALATEPEVLLLDEPTASLDPAATATIETLVRDVSQQGVKVIYVTHDIGQARRLADDVVFLAAGRVVEHANAIDFFDTPSSAEARAYLAGHLLVPGNG